VSIDRRGEARRVDLRIIGDHKPCLDSCRLHLGHSVATHRWMRGFGGSLA
jgi:hypothetical protein